MKKLLLVVSLLSLTACVPMQVRTSPNYPVQVQVDIPPVYPVIVTPQYRPPYPVYDPYYDRKPRRYVYDQYGRPHLIR